MKKLFLLPLAACLLVACPGPVDDNGSGTGGGGGGGTAKTPVVFDYATIGEALEAQIKADDQSTYINTAKTFTLTDGISVAAVGGKMFGRTNEAHGNDGYKALVTLQIKKNGNDVLTFTGLSGYTKIEVESLTTYADSTVDKLAIIKVAGSEVTSADALTWTASGQVNHDENDQTKEYAIKKATLTYTIDATATSFTVSSPAGNAVYFTKITLK